MSSGAPDSPPAWAHPPDIPASAPGNSYKLPPILGCSFLTACSSHFLEARQPRAESRALEPGRSVASGYPPPKRQASAGPELARVWKTGSRRPAVRTASTSKGGRGQAATGAGLGSRGGPPLWGRQLGAVPGARGCSGLWLFGHRLSGSSGFQSGRSRPTGHTCGGRRGCGRELVNGAVPTPETRAPGPPICLRSPLLLPGGIRRRGAPEPGCSSRVPVSACCQLCWAPPDQAPPGTVGLQVGEAGWGQRCQPRRGSKPLLKRSTSRPLQTFPGHPEGPGAPLLEALWLQGVKQLLPGPPHTRCRPGSLGWAELRTPCPPLPNSTGFAAKPFSCSPHPLESKCF